MSKPSGRKRRKNKLLYHDIIPFKYFSSVQRVDIEKYLVLVILGACEALLAGALSIQETEELIFSLDILVGAEDKLKLDKRVVDLIIRGMEIDDVRCLVSEEEMIHHLKDMERRAIRFLKAKSLRDNNSEAPPEKQVD